jgi:HJR/Mrr/RecB family endonuclease
VLYELIQRRYRLTAPQPETINGATVAAVRDRIRHDFQQRSGFDVLLLSPKAAGFGLTLTAANHVIHLNRWWNPAVEDQCSDRVYRIGATKPVTIYLPQAIHSELKERSFDYLLHQLLEEKRALSREIVVPVQFNEQDFRRLFTNSIGEIESTMATHVDHMDWREFEHWVAEQLKRAGFEIKLTSGSNDGGVDVIGIAPNRQIQALFIQCKHTGQGAAGIINEQAIYDLIRARQNYQTTYKNPKLIAVTNGHFSLAATQFAQEQQVVCFGAQYLSLLERHLAALANTNVFGK